jgi:ribokinase
MPPTLAVIGSIVIDIMVQTPRLPASGDNIHVPRLLVTTGGKAGNAAVGFARLGGRPHLIGNTGDDLFGRFARQSLAAEGVDLAGVSVDARAETGAGVLLVGPSRDTAFLIAPGANQTLSPTQLETALRPLLPHLDALLINFEAPEDALLLAAAMARAQGIPLIVDAGPFRPYSPALWRHAAILTPNQREATELSGIAIADEAGAGAAAAALLAQGPAAVVLKLGERGALVATAEGSALVPAFPIQTVDTAGAGDAFAAGLAWGMCWGWPLVQAVRFANACGAVAAGCFGTMTSMPRLAEVEQLLGQGAAHHLPHETLS